MKPRRVIAGGALVALVGGAAAVVISHRAEAYPLCATQCSDGSRCSDSAADGWKRVAPPKTPGFSLVHADFDADNAVALGTDAQRRVVLMGFDRAGHAVRWSASLAGNAADEPDPARVPHILARGEWLGVYGAPGRAAHAVAFDAQTGRRLWDRPLDPGRTVSAVRVQGKLLFLDSNGRAPVVVDVMTGRPQG